MNTSPERIHVYEVGPRDGFQNHPVLIPTDTKIKICEKLLDCGFPRIEITSFVSHRKIPQMADSEKIANALVPKAKERKVILSALVANLIGAEIAVNCGLDEISFTIAVSEAHSYANTSRSVQQSLVELGRIRERFPNIHLNASMTTCFGCRLQGRIPPKDVIELCEQILKAGVDSISLSDTIGAANPRQVEELLTMFREHFPGQTARLHFHNTEGMGLANVYAAINKGFNEFDSSIGGLGGCPFSPGASGNIATEDLVNMLHSMNLTTGIRKDALTESLQEVLKSLSPLWVSHMAAMISVEDGISR